MITIKDKAECTGCTACENICPVGAISLQTDQEGFCYPITDEKSCIHCGLCEKTCPLSATREIKAQPSAYAVKANDEYVLEKSSSGGVFYYLAKQVISCGGIVYGVTINEDIKAKHIGIENLDEIFKIMGSKYVQSDLNKVFIKIKENLIKGRIVMFVGTPCQVAGLHSYLGKKYESLITVDLICHGVPSPKVFDKYVSYLEERFGKKIQDVKFRSKIVSWKRFSFVVKFDDGSEWAEEFTNNTYMKAFINNLILRPSCYRCHFKTVSHVSDITLADFWGVQHIKPSIDSEKGVTLCCTNTPKGEELFDAIKKEMLAEPVCFDEAIKYNSAYMESAHVNRMRRWFFEHLDRISIAKNIEQSISPGLMTRLVLKIKKRKYRVDQWN